MWCTITEDRSYQNSELSNSRFFKYGLLKTRHCKMSFYIESNVAKVCILSKVLFYCHVCIIVLENVISNDETGRLI